MRKCLLIAIITLLNSFTHTNAQDIGAFEVDGFLYREVSTNYVEICGTINNSIDNLIIPSNIIYANQHYTVSGIANRAFFGQTITSLVIPKTITRIGDNAFAYSDLESIQIGEACTWIGDQAFYRCNKLKSIIIPKQVTFIGSGAFSDCENLQRIIVDAGNENWQSIDGGLFTKDGEGLIAFPAAKGGDYIVPDGVRWTGKYAFAGAKRLTSVRFPETFKGLSGDNFYGCTSLRFVYLPLSCEGFIFADTFNGCESLEEITLPAKISGIGQRAFEGCKSLKSITIPNEVSFIEEKAFASCTSLASITLSAHLFNKIDINVFENCPNFHKIIVVQSDGSTKAYNFNSPQP